MLKFVTYLNTSPTCAPLHWIYSSSETLRATNQGSVANLTHCDIFFKQMHPREEVDGGV